MSGDSAGMMPRAFNWSNKPVSRLGDVEPLEPWVLLTCNESSCRVVAVAILALVYDTLAAEDFGPLECSCCRKDLSNPALQSAIIGIQSLPTTHDPVMIMPALAPTHMYSSRNIPWIDGNPPYHNGSESFLIPYSEFCQGVRFPDSGE